MHTCVDDSVLGNDTVLGGVCFNNFEFNSSHTTSYEESVALADGAVGCHKISEMFKKQFQKRTLEEIRLEVDFEQVATQPLDGVVKGEDMYPLSVLDVETLVNVDEIA